MAENLAARIMVGSTMDNQKILTPFTDTDKIRLKTEIVDEITHDPEVNSRKTVPSSAALWQGLRTLRNKVEAIDPHDIAFRDNSVVSLSLINPILDVNNKNILHTGWDWGDNDQTLFTMKDFGENSITIPTSYIPENGYYFIVLHIQRIDSGKVTVCVNGVEKHSFTLAGIQKCEVYIANPDTEPITITAQYITNITHITQISYISVHRVYDRIRNYINYLVGIFGVNGTWATIQQLESMFEVFKTEIDMDSKVAIVSQLLDTHLAASNPHSITPELIDAAPRNHTHRPEQCGAAPEIHGHQPIDVGAAPINHTHTPDQCGAAPVVHTHNPTDIGAATANHIHNPIDIGAAPLIHTHTPEECGAQPVGEYVTKDQIQNQIEHVNKSLSDMQDTIDNITTIIYTLTNITKAQLPTWIDHNHINYVSTLLRSGAYVTDIPHPQFDLSQIDADYTYPQSSYNGSHISVVTDTTSFVLNPNKIGGLTSYGSNISSSYLYIASNNTTPTISITIEFPYELTIQSYTISSLDDYEKPLDWSLYDKQGNEITAINTSTLDYIDNKYTDVLVNAITTDRIELRITGISNLHSTYDISNIINHTPANLYTYLTGLKIHFYEVGTQPNTDHNFIVQATPHRFINRQVYDVPNSLYLALPESKFLPDTVTPYYFYVEHEPVLNQTALHGTPVPPEFSNTRTGTLFHYTDEFKHITSNSQDDNISFTEICSNKTTPFSVFEDGWEVDSGQLSSTLAITWTTPKNIPRIKLSFTQQQVDDNYVPDFIQVEATSSRQNALYDPPILESITVWNNTTTYIYGELCLSNNTYYYSKTNNNLNNDPELDTINFNWVPVGSSVLDWDSLTIYTKDDVCLSNGKYYISTTTNNSNNDPSNPLNSLHWAYLSNAKYIIDSTPTYESIITTKNFANVKPKYNPITNKYDYVMLFNQTKTSSLECAILKITINGTIGQPAIAVDQVSLYLSQDLIYLPDSSCIDQFNQEALSKHYVGYGYIYTSTDPTVPSYINIHPLQIGTSCTIPVNNFTTNIGTFFVPNPYLTKHITCRLLSLDLTTNEIHDLAADDTSVPRAHILKITDEYIKVRIGFSVQETITYTTLLQVTRTW
jgi:hypothetical protein